MSYTIKEMYYTLQGEGAQTGRAAVFCRFTGCNLWTGREQDRAQAACTFCDTDFLGTDGPGGGRFQCATDLASAIADTWSRSTHAQSEERPYVVFTGGEPALQLDEAVVDACHTMGFEVAIETNGTRPLPEGLDWVCVSPKPGQPLLIQSGDELKLVYPQAEMTPAQVDALKFKFFYLQPMDGPHRDRNTAQCIEYCLSHPRWRLSLQTHKLFGIP